MVRMKAERVKKGSGNVFADLRVADPQRALIKAELARRICQVIRERKLSQAKAADLLGLDQPKVSTLMRGRLQGFSTERLFGFLNALDQEVQILIRAVPQGLRRAGTQVIAG